MHDRPKAVKFKDIKTDENRLLNTRCAYTTNRKKILFLNIFEVKTLIQAVWNTDCTKFVNSLNILFDDLPIKFLLHAVHFRLQFHLFESGALWILILLLLRALCGNYTVNEIRIRPLIVHREKFYLKKKKMSKVFPASFIRFPDQTIICELLFSVCFLRFIFHFVSFCVCVRVRFKLLFLLC